ncbi:metal ABC transporter substrate-binding protein [Limnobacter litoralis]|uniref:Zinc ABC transporter substrate-binding protein n=1 Tax=Limnobacter litoralis TaxID=481366 RepID=A0ABQ5YRP9_9BURK|nr:zinc ABC transporter substrate-binding protein [Limnobacter litoralis]GLR26455.1 zinc ABC transporter substrate-binding protein [Limnobacter litoralis]
MKTIYQALAGLALVVSVNCAHAALNVFACEPEWAALSQELAGDKASVFSATNALQDVHHIEAKPSLVAHLRRADLLVCTGSELEIGWLPVVLRQSGNQKTQPGKPGYFEAAQFVKKLEVPTRLDRADGDVHPGGNPHIQTDPRNIALVADALTEQLKQVDAANAAYYQQRHDAFKAKWSAAIAKWEKEAAPLRGVPIVVQHKGFPYLENWLGMTEVASLEPKPGVEPTAAHLQDVLNQIQKQPVKMVIRAAYQSDRPSKWLSDHAHIPAVELPFTVGGTPASGDLYSFFDDTIARLLAALKKGA